jgi:N-acetylmuramic acid 6-phosphate (MurNAc-6-P) etherase
MRTQLNSEPEEKWLEAGGLPSDAALFADALLACPGSPLLSGADAPIFLESGEEALRGSTRLAAGTAQKAALGMLSSLMEVFARRAAISG